MKLAVIFADTGKKDCLLDLDLRAPSLSSTFNNNSKFWVNDYLNKACKMDNILADYQIYKLKSIVCWFGKPFNRSYPRDDSQGQEMGDGGSWQAAFTQRVSKRHEL
jgi:Mrp family chromosome partitioning ATPase